MPRFIRDLLLFSVMQIVMLTGLFWQFYDVRHVSPLSPATVIKHQRLASAPSPRMILIGGSNLLFGIDSAMIAQQTRYHPVNMGLVGGLRLEYIINEINDGLREGDLVVMSLEYNTLNAGANSDETQVIMGVATRRLGNLRFVTWPQWKRLLDQGMQEYLGVCFRQSFGHLGDLAFQSVEDDEEAAVQEGMNAYGDLTRYHDASVKSKEHGEQKTLVKIRPESVEANIKRMNRFVAECRGRGVNVAFSYPPLCRTHYERGMSLARRFHRLLKQQLDAPMLDSPGDMVFDDRNFIGLSYHLRGPAVQERTQRLIDEVNAMR